MARVSMRIPRKERQREQRPRRPPAVRI